jgi:hypothetical protein
MSYNLLWRTVDQKYHKQQKRSKTRLERLSGAGAYPDTRNSQRKYEVLCQRAQRAAGDLEG